MYLIDIIIKEATRSKPSVATLFSTVPSHIHTFKKVKLSQLWPMGWESVFYGHRAGHFFCSSYLSLPRSLAHIKAHIKAQPYDANSYD